MKPEEFKILLEKFFAGESSEQEETALRAMFEQDEYAEQYPDVKQQFLLMLEMEKENSLDESFDQRILQEISKQKISVANRKIWDYRISGVAAAVLLFLAIWLGPELFQPKVVYGTITDPKIAFSTTRKILDTIAQKMNKGTAPMKKTVKELDKNLSKISHIKQLDKSMEKMKKLEDLNRTSELFKSFSKISVNYGNL
jgi:hypothetical protein